MSAGPLLDSPDTVTSVVRPSVNDQSYEDSSAWYLTAIPYRPLLPAASSRLGYHVELEIIEVVPRHLHPRAILLLNRDLVHADIVNR